MAGAGSSNSPQFSATFSITVGNVEQARAWLNTGPPRSAHLACERSSCSSGTASLGGALGLWSLVSLPFTVALPPLTGALYAASGSYGQGFSVQIALFAVAAVAPWLGAYRASSRH